MYFLLILIFFSYFNAMCCYLPLYFLMYTYCKYALTALLPFSLTGTECNSSLKK